MSERSTATRLKGIQDAQGRIDAEALRTEFGPVGSSALEIAVEYLRSRGWQFNTSFDYWWKPREA